jgi:hypothetical protein
MSAIETGPTTQSAMSPQDVRHRSTLANANQPCLGRSVGYAAMMARVKATRETFRFNV